MKSFIAIFEIIDHTEFVDSIELGRVLSLLDKNFQQILKDAIVEPHNNSVDDFPMDIIGCSSIANCIILWTPELTHAYFVKLVMSSIMTLAISLQNGFPLRGYITIGEYGGIPIGALTLANIHHLPTMHAYRTVQTHDWIGCTVGRHAAEAFHEMAGIGDASIDTLRRAHILLKYPVPISVGPVREEYVVNWVHNTADELPLKALHFSFRKHRRRVLDIESSTIITNTERFITYLRGQRLN